MSYRSILAIATMTFVLLFVVGLGAIVGALETRNQLVLILGALISIVLAILLAHFVAAKLRPDSAEPLLTTQRLEAIRKGSNRERILHLLGFVGGCMYLTGVLADTTRLATAGQFIFGLYFIIHGYALVTNQPWIWEETRVKSPQWTKYGHVVVGFVFVGLATFRLAVGV